jgi:hypothetical protein
MASHAFAPCRFELGSVLQKLFRQGEVTVFPKDTPTRSIGCVRSAPLLTDRIVPYFYSPALTT